MYKLAHVYGTPSYEEWRKQKPDDLSYTKIDSSDAWGIEFCVHSYHELKEVVDFLTVMNKRLALYFRGQSQPWEPLPVLFRDEWPVYGTRCNVRICNHSWYMNQLIEIGEEVYKICRKIGVPRWRGLRDIREAQWAIVQHYGLWPTPLLDVTTSLRVAATFALGIGDHSGPREGYILVTGFPYGTGSISFDIDQHTVLARLQSVCPPQARRPHLQEGFLVGRFPFDITQKRIDKKSNLRRRLVAKIKVVDSKQTFWDEDFPRHSQDSLLPPEGGDEVEKALFERFGQDGEKSIAARIKVG